MAFPRCAFFRCSGSSRYEQIDRRDPVVVGVEEQEFDVHRAFLGRLSILRTDSIGIHRDLTKKCASMITVY